MVTYDQAVQVVEALDAQGYIRKKKITGNWYTIYCPFHGGGNEKKPSCGVLLKGQTHAGKYTDAGFFNCFACHHAAPLVPSVDKILKLHQVEKSATDWLVENVPGIEIEGADTEYDDLVPGGIVTAVTSKFALDYIASKTKSLRKQYIPESELETYRYTVPYMYERGLTDRIIDRYDIGFDANHIPENKNKPVPCVTFPVRDRQGRCLFIFRRSVEGRYFNYPTGVEKPLYGIYELSPKAKTVVICESAFNMMTCVRHGYEAVALFGTGNSLQIQQLKELGVRRFIIALDPDEAGQRGTQKLRRALKGNAFISEMKGIPSGKDLNDLTDEEFDKLYVE